MTVLIQTTLDSFGAGILITGVQLEKADPPPAVIDAFELGFRMQSELPSVMDLSGETQQTLDLYGIGAEPTDNFGRQCLLARKFAESGVRFVFQADYLRHGRLHAER